MFCLSEHSPIANKGKEVGISFFNVSSTYNELTMMMKGHPYSTEHEGEIIPVQREEHGAKGVQCLQIF